MGDPPLQLPPKGVWASPCPNRQTQGVNPHPPHLGGRLAPHQRGGHPHNFGRGTHTSQLPPPQGAPSNAAPTHTTPPVMGGAAAGKGVGSRPHTQSAQPPRWGGRQTDDDNDDTPNLAHTSPPPPQQILSPQGVQCGGLASPCLLPFLWGASPDPLTPAFGGGGNDTTLMPLRNPPKWDHRPL